MTQNIFRLLLSIASLLGLMACTNSEPATHALRTQTIEATIPVDDASLRTSISPSGNAKDYAVSWRQGDKIDIFIEQEGKVFYMEAVEAKEISADGRTCKFSYSLPPKIKVGEAYDLYGVHGAKAYAKGSKEVLIDLQPICGASVAEFVAPLYFHTTIRSSEEVRSVQFKHLGMYQFVHIENKSKAPISVKWLHFNPWGVGGDPLNPYSTNSYRFNPKTQSVVKGTALSPLIKAARTIQPKGSDLFVSWHYPSDKPVGTVVAVATVDGKPTTSNERSGATVQSFQIGKGYHLYTTWDGTKLTIGELDPLALEFSTVELNIGKVKEIDVTQGNALRLENDREEIIAVNLTEGGRKIRLEGKSEGTANIKVFNATHYVVLQVTVNKQEDPEEPPIDPNIPWEEITSEDYELSSDGLTLVKWKNQNTKHLDMNREPRLKKVTDIGSHAFYNCGSLTSINIPNSVTSIGEGAFEYCSSLTSINIPNSVTSIGEGAFSDCRSLTSINIPNSVTSIEDGAFGGCSSLTSINIPNSVTSIGEGAFSSCTSLTSVNIPNSVTSIGVRAFSDCRSLTSINIPNSVTSIGVRAFGGCSSLTSINIPNSVTSIGEWAFSDCRSLTSINIPNSVTSIGEGAFSSCTSLTSINIPNSVTSIGREAFWDCSSLTSINIPNSVTSIGRGAFSSCTSLTSINIPNSVTSIGKWAFSSCTSLTSINIPNSVTSIGWGAFSDCSSLTSITIRATTYVTYTYKMLYNTSKLKHIYVPADLVEKYRKAPGWKDFADKIETIP